MLTGLFRNIFVLGQVFIFLICGQIESHAQKDPLKEGNRAFQEDHFREALIYYNQIEKINNSAPILFKRGVCYYEINQLDRAIADFQRAWEYGYKNPEIDFYTGLIQHHKGSFKLAAEYYKKFLKELEADDVRRQSVVKKIKQCGRAIDLSYKRPLAIIEKLPGGINTAYDEVGLVESPSKENRYYFTSNRPNLTSSLSASDYDIYWMSKEETKYSEPKRMKYVINKRDNEVLLGFTPSADGLYFYRGKDHEGAIYINKGTGDGARTKAVNPPGSFSLINSDAYFFDDQVIIYSSKDGQGYGGYDLYASIFKDGQWTKPMNLGSEINSPYDEISPYLSFDGSELYFSSNKNESIGGHDIFYSHYLYEADKWSNPQNMGIPVNSPGDDTHFSLSYDGLTAMLTSDRKNSFGGKDIYIARFKDPRGSQGYGVEELTFLNYKIPDRSKILVNNDLEKDLATDMDIDSSTAQMTNQVNVTSHDSIIVMQYDPIYFSSGLDLVNEKNVENIEELIKMMIRTPSLEIELNCHTSESGILEYKLFSSLKVAERLEKYFKKKGLADDRIHIKGLADSYPLAKTWSEGGDGKYADMYNSRIEINFSNYDKRKISINRNAPGIPAYARNNKYELYQTLLEDAITYKIQIAVVGQMYRGMALDLFNDAAVEEDATTGLYAYTIGLYDSYGDALKVKRDMDRLGITDAQVIAYFNGSRLSDDQHVYYVNDFPDLRNLMNFKE